MKDIANDVKIIIVLVQHPVFGSQLIPYMVKEMPDDTLKLLEQAFHAPEAVLARMTDAERKAIEIASRYSEKSLMSVYSKEKTVNAFHKKLTEDTLKRTIRPFIEKKLAEMVDLIRDNHLPFYQNKTGNKVLYKHSAYEVSPYITKSSFHFEANDEHFTYSLSCSRNGERVDLMEKKPVITITTSPAILLMGDELHVFNNIQASRILPFTNKRAVSVDVVQTDRYMENIVLPTIRNHDVTAKGLPIFEEQRKCEAGLALENNVYDKPVLQLQFAYGDKIFYPGSESAEKYADIADENGRKAIRYFYRDSEKESMLAEKLKQSGLQLVSDSFYRLRDDSPMKNLSEWIIQHKDLIAENYRLVNADKNADYCLDEISIQQDVSETNDWFELHITVKIGNFSIPFIRFRRNILDENREFTLPDGRIILLPEEWFAKYGDVFRFSEKNDTAIQLKHSFIGVVENAFKDDADKIKISYRQKERMEVPTKIKATLRQYQTDGFNWMVHLHKHNLGGILADDMGLGKTLQTLTLLQLIYKEAGNRLNIGDGNDENGLSLFNASDEKRKIPASLIVVPTSLLHNWKREISKFTALTVHEYAGGTHLKGYKMEQVFDCFDLVLTTYGIMRNYIDELVKYKFEYVILDESQNIKNSDSLTFRSAIKLRNNHRLVLTGTPIENSLKDLWSQFHFIEPALLGSESNFQKHYITSVKHGDKSTEERLHRLIAPFILRRSKQEVAPELPSLTEEIIFCEMTDEQSEIYNQKKNGLRNILLQNASGSNEHNNLTVLNGIMQLRQLACHPAMVDPGFTGTSGKMDEILSTFQTLQSEGHKVLIFSSFVKHLELIARAFDENGWKYAMLTGASHDREKEIDRFNASDDISVFLISLKAGGVGLNLTQADYVFIVDPWWNPAAEMQAISRAHRIGQDKQVFAYRFITENSIEEKIIHLQEGKRKLSETFVTDSNPFEAMTDEEWAKLLEG